MANSKIATWGDPKYSNTVMGNNTFEYKWEVIPSENTTIKDNNIYKNATGGVTSGTVTIPGSGPVSGGSYPYHSPFAPNTGQTSPYAPQPIPNPWGTGQQQFPLWEDEVTEKIRVDRLDRDLNTVAVDIDDIIQALEEIDEAQLELADDKELSVKIQNAIWYIQEAKDAIKKAKESGSK